jgi:hypothetical protein
LMVMIMILVSSNRRHDFSWLSPKYCHFSFDHELPTHSVVELSDDRLILSFMIRYVNVSVSCLTYHVFQVCLICHFSVWISDRRYREAIGRSNTFWNSGVDKASLVKWLQMTYEKRGEEKSRKVISYSLIHDISIHFSIFHSSYLSFPVKNLFRVESS